MSGEVESLGVQSYESTEEDGEEHEAGQRGWQAEKGSTGAARAGEGRVS